MTLGVAVYFLVGALLVIAVALAFAAYRESNRWSDNS